MIKKFVQNTEKTHNGKNMRNFSLLKKYEIENSIKKIGFSRKNLKKNTREIFFKNKFV